MLEYLWRGWSHWSMALAGGLCFGLLGFVSDCLQGQSLPVRCAAGASVITSVEFLFGCIFNLALGMHVWDYSDELLNIAGQVCARYSALWFVLCLPLMRLTDRLVVRDSLAVGAKTAYNKNRKPIGRRMRQHAASDQRTKLSDYIGML